MKNVLKYLLIMMFVSASLTGCKRATDEVTPTGEFDILTNYLVDSNMDLDHVIKSASGNKFVMAPAEASDVADRYIMDIRKAEDFNAGHIDGAENVAFADILTEAANAGGKQILVVCRTGQTACYATALLRLYGYTEAQALKWGMSGWHSDFDEWTTNCSSPATNHSNWTNDGEPEKFNYNAPVLSTGNTDGASILKARVEAVVAAGFKTVSGTDALDNPDDYFINNYFSGDHYTGFGHISGAYRINPVLVGNGSILNLDPSKFVVTYCYTGQTSGVITAYLNVLGYNAKSLTFGVNGLTHDNDFWTSGQVSNHWGMNSNPKDFNYVQ
jgi:rhodanese-related sulfurtransferase